MRNALIIAICGLLIAGAGALIVFGGEMFGAPDERDRREAVSERDAGRADDEPSDAASSADDTVGDTKTALLGADDIESQLRVAVDDINARAPIRIDELTRMTAARAEGRRLIYRYEIDRELTDRQAAEFEDLATRQNRETLCANPQSRALFDLGAEVEYVYFDASGDRLFSTPIAGC